LKQSVATYPFVNAVLHSLLRISKFVLGKTNTEEQSGGRNAFCRAQTERDIKSEQRRDDQAGRPDELVKKWPKMLPNPLLSKINQRRDGQTGRPD
jgi:hypothetical protein